MYPPPLRSKCVGWGWGWCALLTHLSPCLRVQPPLTPLQGTEAGGHTGDIATMPLIPQCTATVFDVIVDGPFLRFKMVINSKRRALLGARAYTDTDCCVAIRWHGRFTSSGVDLCRGHVSPLNGAPVAVIGAGGIFDGRGMAAALALGAQAVWVGTRFVAAEESGAGPRHRSMVCSTDSDSTVRTLIFSGRPMRVFKNECVSPRPPLHARRLHRHGRLALPASS